eukprot:CAMPEP_0118822682 /NCGR_PEP_ID=MMETSP1162-20130426/9364_1 /TAXON_ID=33656 /ORGANISM="Phaeocystis Sp, Strain CCMP2710" /LENGTH=121 /DNA_ID=CAMNT_0006753253 /DNA_START=266 /DNA_END=629 /DNA_ORIENTATION=+
MGPQGLQGEGRGAGARRLRPEADQDGLYHPAAVSVCHGERDGRRERGAACGGLPPLAPVRPVHGDAEVFQGAVVDVPPTAPTAVGPWYLSALHPLAASPAGKGGIQGPTTAGLRSAARAHA